MAKALTQLTLDALKPSENRREVPDGKVVGLFLIVQPSGAKSWAVRYRVEGKPKKLTIGNYPAIDLIGARRAAQSALADVAGGVDPAAAKQAKRRAAATEGRQAQDLVETVVATFVERYAKKQTRETSARETERLLTREVVGKWRGTRLSQIGRADVHSLLDGIVDRGAPIVANRTLAALRRMCAWAVERGLIENSPCEKVRAPAAETSRDRILSEDEIRAAWAAFDVVGWPFGPLAQLLLVTGQRLRELAEARWSEVDLKAKTWTIPKERAKNGVAHEVPLSAAALRILSALPRVEAGRRTTGLIFTTTGHSAVSGFSRAKEGFDAAMREAAIERDGDPDKMEHWTMHDLRRTSASGMAALGVAPHVCEAVLNHKSGTIRGVAAVYNRYNYSAEKRAALEAWGRHLDSLISGALTPNAVELATARR